MFKIGYRTLKTALGTALAIYLAQLLHLQNFASAGIITILCIQITQKRSLQASYLICRLFIGDRLLICLFRADRLLSVCDRNIAGAVHSDYSRFKNKRRDRHQLSNHSSFIYVRRHYDGVYLE